MRNFLFSSLVATPPTSERRRFAVPEPTCSIEPIRGDKPVPAKRSDISTLRGILYYLKAQPRHDSPVVRRSHVDALERFIAELEEKEPPSPLWWLAGALKNSYKKVGTMYIVTDRDLATWTLDKLFEMFPDDEG